MNLRIWLCRCLAKRPPPIGGRRAGRGAIPMVLGLVTLFGLGLMSTRPAGAAFLWGANGHPLTSYPGIPFEGQIRLVAEAGLRSYRVDVTNLNQMDRLADLLAVGRARGVTILPILIPPVDLAKSSESEIYATSFEFAQRFVARFSGDVPVWELGNELESYAIIQPCETRDDGSKYPCEWGPAGGVSELEYVGARFKKVEAVLRGLSEGARAASLTARRAIGSAGWGHLGSFGRLRASGIDWEISVWHMYGQDPEWAFKYLATLNKPVWVTEFNHPYGSAKEGEQKQADGLAGTMHRLLALAPQYNVQGAYLYELLDEPYWAPSFEASMGLVRVLPDPAHQWKIGEPKIAFEAVKQAAAATTDMR